MNEKEISHKEDFIFMPTRGLCGMPLYPKKSLDSIEFLGKLYFFDSENCLNSFAEGTKVVYVYMKIGKNKEIPTYSGEGVLESDLIRSSADLRTPLIALTFVSKKAILNKITLDG